VTAIMAAADPLAVEHRGAFLEAVASALAGYHGELGEGAVFRVCSELQRRFWTPPTLDNGRLVGAGKYR
jgi:hypothetical protein